MYKKYIRPILFKYNPDILHLYAVRIGYVLGRTGFTRAILKKFFAYSHPMLETSVCGIEFKNPVGLAGGFDKNAQLIQTMPAIGFGFTEVGSITRYPYKGNARPWNIRLPEEEAIIVNYGLKNEGAGALRRRIRKEKREIPVIINIAKTNDSSIKGDETIEDYIHSFRTLESLADFININISCPNSGDGVLLCEDMGLLKKLLDALEDKKPERPLFLKIKPDISKEIVDEIIKLSKKHSCVKGFIISNLTKDRTLLQYTDPKSIENYKGGVSGAPMRQRSTNMIAYVYNKTKGEYPIIGVGGIFTAQDAYEKICAGASLVQLITGMIYEGPMAIKKINQGLVKLCEADGYTNISQAVGSKAKEYKG